MCGFAPEDAPPPKKRRDLAKQKLLEALKMNDRVTYSGLIGKGFEPSEI